MKPLGTITKYYPFIDEDLKAILNSLMDVSRSYYDLVQRLCTFVLASDVPDELAINLSWIKILAEVCIPTIPCN
ncbi:MAG: hypothetical protein AM324_001645 [Candidatus Thorarchaeota archaeon SMTZ1-83]|nr:MAG: hypothetical protein AM324_02555 [Candidatus Thorarchaeota archaeon SMTZ1-83]